MTTAWFGGVQRWTLAEIEADVAVARADFRTRRLGEPLARYLARVRCRASPPEATCR